MFLYEMKSSSMATIKSHYLPSLKNIEDVLHPFCIMLECLYFINIFGKDFLILPYSLHILKYQIFSLDLIFYAKTNRCILLISKFSCTFNKLFIHKRIVWVIIGKEFAMFSYFLCLYTQGYIRIFQAKRDHKWKKSMMPSSKDG